MKRILSCFYIIFALLLLPAAALAQSTLPSPKDANKAAAMHNDEGISHYVQGHWDVAEKHFREAIQADPKFAIANYNLALALHNAKNHKEATKHFQKAYDLAPKNKKIRNSKVLLGHIGK